MATDVPAPGLPAPDDLVGQRDAYRTALSACEETVFRFRARYERAEADNERLRGIEDAARQFTTWGYGSDAPDDCKRDFQLLLDALAVSEGATDG